MTPSDRLRSLIIRSAVVLVLLGGLCLFTVHQHDGHATDSHCAICHFATGLSAPVVALVLSSNAAVIAFGYAVRLFGNPWRVLLASPCGLRAPPISL